MLGTTLLGSFRSLCRDGAARGVFLGGGEEIVAICRILRKEILPCVENVGQKITAR
ncbi:hypothetical protein DA2_3179 [Desulfovibrio sp. A2]|nr:hypothetical protein DA2_3179 [Desulfovibrio sp. A2]